MTDVTTTIDGQPVAEASFDVINPATAAPESTAPDCTAQQLDAAMVSAEKAYRDWRSDEAVRREPMRRAADARIGVGNGTWGLLAFSEPQVIHTART